MARVTQDRESGVIAVDKHLYKNREYSAYLFFIGVSTLLILGAKSFFHDTRPINEYLLFLVPGITVLLIPLYKWFLTSVRRYVAYRTTRIQLSRVQKDIETLQDNPNISTEFKRNRQEQLVTLRLLQGELLQRKLLYKEVAK
jgi:hypothetical protein